METFRIRKAEEADLQEIVRLWKGNIKTVNTKSEIADLFHSFTEYFFVVVYMGALNTNTNMSEEKNSFDNSVIGFVGGSLRSGHGHISGIAVDKKYRMKGAGRWLLKAVSAEFLNDNLDRVTLEVRKSNTGAIRFYEKQGYRRSYIVKGYYADGEDAIVYEKQIREPTSGQILL